MIANCKNEMLIVYYFTQATRRDDIEEFKKLSYDDRLINQLKIMTRTTTTEKKGKMSKIIIKLATYIDQYIIIILRILVLKFFRIENIIYVIKKRLFILQKRREELELKSSR